MANGAVIDAGSSYIVIWTDGNLTLGQLTDSYTFLGSGGAVLDGNGSANNVEGYALVIDSGTGIGSGDALETEVSCLAARVTTGHGNIEIVNTGDLYLGDLAGWGYAVQNFGTGTVNITVNSNMAVDSPVISNGGKVTLITNSGVILQTSTGDITTNGGLYTGTSTGDYWMADGAVVNTGNGDIHIDAIGADITIGQLITNNNVLLHSGGVILDGGDTGGEDIQAGGAELLASTGIGNGNAIETLVTNLSAATATGPININETDALNVTQVGVTTGITTPGDVNITTNGDLSLDIISGADVNLTSTAGALYETGAGDAGIDITSTDLTISSSTGIGSGNALEPTADRLAARVTTGNGNIEIVNTGDLDLVDLAGWGYAVQNFGTGTIDITVNYNITIAGKIISGGGDISLTATSGAIIDDNAVDPDISGPAGVGLQMTASSGIGNGNEIETDVTALSAGNSTSGDIRIDNTGDLNILAPGVINSAPDGEIVINVASNLNVNSNVTSNNSDITLTASDSINKSTGTLIGSTGGDIALLADTDDNGFGGITQSGTASVVSGGGDILLQAGVATGGDDVRLTRLDAG